MRTVRFGAALFLAVLGTAAPRPLVGPTEAAVYWGNGWAIGAADLDGSQCQFAYFRPDPETYGQIGAVAVSSDYLYWGGRAGIGRVPLFGPEVPEHIVTTDSPVTGLALDGAHVYWTTTGGEAVGRAGLDGSAANPQLVGGLKDARGVAVDSQHLYWTATTTIGRSDLDGLGVERAFRETAPSSPPGSRLAVATSIGLQRRRSDRTGHRRWWAGGVARGQRRSRHGAGARRRQRLLDAGLRSR